MHRFVKLILSWVVAAPLVCLAQSLPATTPKAVLVTGSSTGIGRSIANIPETKVEEFGTIRTQIRHLVQLNEGQPYTYDRDALIKMLDEALAGVISVEENRIHRASCAPGLQPDGPP
jgi:hypothetical protein